MVETPSKLVLIDFEGQKQWASFKSDLLERKIRGFWRTGEAERSMGLWVSRVFGFGANNSND